jgi:hypothetical protein
MVTATASIEYLLTYSVGRVLSGELLVNYRQNSGVNRMPQININSVVFFVMTPSNLHFYPEDEGSIFLRIVGSHLPNYTKS